MSISEIAPARAWGLLADLDEEEREAKISQTYADLASLPDEEVRSQVLAMVSAECDLPDDKLRGFMVSRIRVWLKVEPDLVKRISGYYDEAFAMMTAAQGMRWAGMRQTRRADFTQEDRQRLVVLAPTAFGCVDEADLRSFSRNNPDTGTSAPASKASKKSWWPFGKR